MARLEVLFWSALVRILLALLPTEQVVSALNTLPRGGGSSSSSTIPSDDEVALAGACLGRALARSQYLRRRGQPHTVVIGVSGTVSIFAAHAWLDPYDPMPEGYAEIRRIPR